MRKLRWPVHEKNIQRRGNRRKVGLPSSICWRRLPSYKQHFQRSQEGIWPLVGYPRFRSNTVRNDQVTRGMVEMAGTFNLDKTLPKGMRQMYSGSLCVAPEEPNTTSGQKVQARRPHCKNFPTSRTTLTMELYLWTNASLKLVHLFSTTIIIFAIVTNQPHFYLIFFFK